jgi:hypothetical protein
MFENGANSLSRHCRIRDARRTLYHSRIWLVLGTCLAILPGDYSLLRANNAWHVATLPAVIGPAEEMEAWKWNR